MSTLYTDPVGNIFLGNCEWGNHDIDYSATNWLRAHATSNRAGFLTDMQAILGQAGFSAITVASDYPTVTNAPIFEATIASGGLNLRHYTALADVSRIEYLGAVNYLIPEISSSVGYGYFNHDFQYAACASANSLSLLKWVVSTNRVGFTINPQFLYSGLLEEVNTNFGYYSVDKANHHISISLGVGSGVSYGTTINNLHFSPQHFIAGTSKTLLQSGDAQYPIICANSNNPTAQWATDMYVFDNDANLGFPCIGKVPNLLLGTGTYNFFKPVNVQISALDEGSPWYLPVGRYAGKVLLMRVYSSVQ